MEKLFRLCFFLSNDVEKAKSMLADVLTHSPESDYLKVIYQKIQKKPGAPEYAEINLDEFMFPQEWILFRDLLKHQEYFNIFLLTLVYYEDSDVQKIAKITGLIPEVIHYRIDLLKETYGDVLISEKMSEKFDSLAPVF